jgi:conjugative transfer region protein (TIGR03750 family)
MLPDLLNEEPTAWKGFTQVEIVQTVTKQVIIHIILWLIGGIFIGVPGPLLIVVIAFGMASGAAFGFAWLKLYVSNKKAGTPYGYYERKVFLNSWMVKLGLRNPKTIQRTGLWRHFK